MLIYVLDASAYIRFLDREAGGDDVAEVLNEQAQKTAQVIMSAVQWGEIVKIITKRKSTLTIAKLERDLRTLGVEIVPADSERAKRSALLGIKYKIAYADAFGLELASHSHERILITADYGVKPAEVDIRIKFLPVKQKP